MNKLLFAKIAVITLALSAWLMPKAAADPQKEKRQPREVRTAGGLIVDSEERYVMITGSNIPQRVRLKSIGTDGMHNVRIFTQRELQTINGGFGVRGIALDPSVRISGR